jgi:hypothetical protein
MLPPTREARCDSLTEGQCCRLPHQRFQVCIKQMTYTWPMFMLHKPSYLNSRAGEAPVHPALLLSSPQGSHQCSLSRGAGQKQGERQLLTVIMQKVPCQMPPPLSGL